MKETMFKLRLLLRSETALTQVKAEKLMVSMIILACALVFGLLTLSALNFALFVFLSESHSMVVSALLVALFNALIAVALVIYSGSVMKEGRDEKIATEMRDLAYQELSADVESIKEDINMIRSGLAGVSGTFSTVAPLLGIALKSVTKTKA